MNQGCTEGLGGGTVDYYCWINNFVNEIILKLKYFHENAVIVDEGERESGKG